MRKTLTPLSLLTTAGIFVFVGMLYLTVFASVQKSWAQTIDQLLSHCQSVGNPPSPRDIWNSTKTVNECINQCNVIYSMCQVRNLCQPISICSQLKDICIQGCTPAAPPPAPSCSSQGGACQYSACGTGGYINGTCSSPYMTCCTPITPCAFYGGTCVGASSGGVAPCPAGKTYNTSLSCNSNYMICCSAAGAGPPGGGGGPGGGPPPPPPTYNIYGKVYDAVTGSPGVGGVALKLTSGSWVENQTSNGSGNYSFLGYLAGTYNIQITVPAGWTNTTPTSVRVTVPPTRTGINFGIVRLYTISGNVFNDVNKNRVKDGGEANVSGISMSANGGNLSVNSGAGTYTVTNLLAGTYNVAYTTSPLPAGYFMTWPRSGPPPTLSITVGPNCGNNVQTYGLTCNNGNVSNANFGISNSVPWWQSYGLNVRDDNGLDDKIPINPLYPPYASVSDQSNAF